MKGLGKAKTSQSSQRRTPTTRGSKDKGGEYDFFGHGKMVPEFEKAASRSNRQISEPVETQFGYHIIKLEERGARQPLQPRMIRCASRSSRS